MDEKKNFFTINSVLLVVLAALFVYNQNLIGSLQKELGVKNVSFAAVANSVFSRAGDKLANSSGLTGDLTQDAVKLVVQKGIPEKYGEKLGVSFDQVVTSMDIMKEFDPTYGKEKIALAGNDLQRYIDIALKISCEFCCGAPAIIDKTGAAACGCAHSQAMRGLAAYLIKNYGQDYTNDQILRELARWKGAFFPKGMAKKVSTQLSQGNFTPDVSARILDIKLPVYEKGTQSSPANTDVNNLPGAVGGC